jgi:hypothetical protein
MMIKFKIHKVNTNNEHLVCFHFKIYKNEILGFINKANKVCIVIQVNGPPKCLDRPLSTSCPNEVNTTPLMLHLL